MALMRISLCYFDLIKNVIFWSLWMLYLDYLNTHKYSGSKMANIVIGSEKVHWTKM